MSSRKCSFDFTYNGKNGSVMATFGPNRGVKSSGFTAIAGRFTDNVVKGFPVIMAEVKYGGLGYESMLGWVQIVTHRYPGGPESEVSVDVAEMFQGYQNPYCFYGYKPTLYDAPCHNPGVTMEWIAYSFLSPLKQIDENEKKMVAPVVGFKWGYALKNGKIDRIFQPESVYERKWVELSREVRGEYSDWTFKEGFA